MDTGRARTVYEILSASDIDANCTMPSSVRPVSLAGLPTGPSWVATMADDGARHDGGRMMPKARRTWELNPKFGADDLGAGPARGGRAYGDGLVDEGLTDLEVDMVHGVLDGMPMISRNLPTEPNPCL